ANGDLRLWKDLSGEGRLGYITSAAAMYDVPFEVFAEAVRDCISDSRLLEAALRTVLQNGHELSGLSKLLPDDGRTESTQLSTALRRYWSNIRKWLRWIKKAGTGELKGRCVDDT